MENKYVFWCRTLEDIEEFEYDEITGAKAKRPVMSVLNKKKLSKYEMDDLFAGDYW